MVLPGKPARKPGQPGCRGSAQENCGGTRAQREDIEAPGPGKHRAPASGPGSAGEVVEHVKAQVQNAESPCNSPDQRDVARRILSKNIPDQYCRQMTPVSVVVFYETQHTAIEELIRHSADCSRSGNA